MDSIAYGIGQNGGINKDASNLAAGETFSVKGSYADATWKLHPWRIIILGLATLAILVLVVWLVRRTRRVVAAAAPSKPAAAPVALNWADPWFILSGLGSAVAIGLLTAGLLYLGTPATGSEDPFMEVVLAIAAILAYAVVVIGPAVVPGLGPGPFGRRR